MRLRRKCLGKPLFSVGAYPQEGLVGAWEGVIISIKSRHWGQCRGLTLGTGQTVPGLEEIIHTQALEGRLLSAKTARWYDLTRVLMVARI